MRRPAITRRRQQLRKLLAESRRAAGITQTQLGRQLGRSQSFVSKVENGELQLDVIEFLDVSRALDLDPARVLAEIDRVR